MNKMQICKTEYFFTPMRDEKLNIFNVNISISYLFSMYYLVGASLNFIKVINFNQ